MLAMTARMSVSLAFIAGFTLWALAFAIAERFGK